MSHMEDSVKSMQKKKEHAGDWRIDIKYKTEKCLANGPVCIFVTFVTFTEKVYMGQHRSDSGKSQSHSHNIIVLPERLGNHNAYNSNTGEFFFFNLS